LVIEQGQKENDHAVREKAFVCFFTEAVVRNNAYGHVVESDPIIALPSLGELVWVSPTITEVSPK